MPRDMARVKVPGNARDRKVACEMNEANRARDAVPFGRVRRVRKK